MLADCDEGLPCHPVRRDEINTLQVNLPETSENVRRE
jgi:hypothetical protein